MFVIIQIHHHTIFSYCLTKEKPSKDISFYKPNLPLKRNPHIIDILLSIKIQELENTVFALCRLSLNQGK